MTIKFGGLSCAHGDTASILEESPTHKYSIVLAGHEKGGLLFFDSLEKKPFGLTIPGRSGQIVVGDGESKPFFDTDLEVRGE